MVASVGQTAITESDVEQEYRFERFMEGLSPVGFPDASARRVLLNRLISRTLLAEDMLNSGLTLKPTAESARQELAEIRKRFGGGGRFQAALEDLGMSKEQVLERLEGYERTLEYIDQRFRPVTPPRPAEVRAYYESNFAPEYRKLHSTPPPPLERVEAPIRQILLQQKLDQRLNEWLKDMRTTEPVRIHGEEGF